MTQIPSRTGKVAGVDMSKWQWGPVEDPQIDWTAVAAQGVKFAILRGGLGEHYEDPFFERGVNEAREAGINVGGYFVFDPYINVEVDDQLNNVRKIVAGLDIKMGRGDFELPWVGRCTVQQLRNNVYEYCMGLREIFPSVGLHADAVPQPNAGIYTAAWWWNTPIAGRVLPKDPPPYGNKRPWSDNNNPDIRAKGWSLWFASYGGNNGLIPGSPPVLPRGWTEWDIWQYTDVGRLEGVDSSVDFNLMREELFDAIWGGVPVTPPAPVDPPVVIEPGDEPERGLPWGMIYKV